MEQEIVYKVIHRPVRRARLEYTRQGLRVIVPQSRTFDVPKFVATFKRWIWQKKMWYDNMAKQSDSLFLADRTDRELIQQIKYYLLEAEQSFGVSSSQVRLRAMKRQWGNCTSHGRLTFNKRLAKLPNELVRYIVFHEACHLRSMKHGKLFHKLMLKHFPDLKQKEQLLSAYGYKFGIEE